MNIRSKIRIRHGGYCDYCHIEQVNVIEDIYIPRSATEGRYYNLCLSCLVKYYRKFPERFRNHGQAYTVPGWEGLAS